MITDVRLPCTRTTCSSQSGPCDSVEDEKDQPGPRPEQLLQYLGEGLPWDVVDPLRLHRGLRQCRLLEIADQAQAAAQIGRNEIDRSQQVPGATHVRHGPGERARFSAAPHTAEKHRSSKLGRKWLGSGSCRRRPSEGAGSALRSPAKCTQSGPGFSPPPIRAHPTSRLDPPRTGCPTSLVLA